MKSVTKDLKLTSILLLFSIILIFFDHLGFLNFPKILLQNITVPVQFGIYTTGSSISKQFSSIIGARTAAKENVALKKQLADLLTENAALRKTLAEDKTLISQQGALGTQTYDLIAARPLRFGRFLSIDKGSSDGVKVGEVVIFKDNYVGIINEVTPKTSQVLLPQDPDSKIAVFSQSNDGRARGILQGQFESKMLMDKILHQENISNGDLIYSEGTEGKLPRGLIIGKVGKVRDLPSEIFKQAEIETIYNPVDLDVVFVIKDS